MRYINNLNDENKIAPSHKKAFWAIVGLSVAGTFGTIAIGVMLFYFIMQII